MVRRSPRKRTSSPRTSTLNVVDLPIASLEPDVNNPNVMDEDTLDLLVDEIQEHGFDEPIQVRKLNTGRYQISGGHHRVMAAERLGMETVPAVIKDFDDRTQKLMLAKRNLLRGKMDRQKLGKLVADLSKTGDPGTLHRELGITQKKTLDAMIDKAGENLTPKQKAKLDVAKEKIKSIDDLSSILNTIFKETGSEAKSGYMVFSFGGKEHHYVQIDISTNKKLRALKKECDAADIPMRDFLQSIVAAAELPSGIKAVIKPKNSPRKRRRVKK